MSFTKIAPKDIKLRCGQCGETRNVRTLHLQYISIDVCKRCERKLNEPMRPDAELSFRFKVTLS